MTSAAFVSRGSASVCRLFIFLPHWVEPLPICLKRKKKNSCRWFGCLKRVLAFVQCDCSVFTSCLHTPNTPNSDVHVYFFCCSLGFFNLSSTFLAHKLLQESGQWKSFLGSPNLVQTCSCAPLTSGTFDSFYASWWKDQVTHSVQPQLVFFRCLEGRVMWWATCI